MYLFNYMQMHNYYVIIAIYFFSESLINYANAKIPR